MNRFERRALRSRFGVSVLEVGVDWLPPQSAKPVMGAVLDTEHMKGPTAKECLRMFRLEQERRLGWTRIAASDVEEKEMGGKVLGWQWMAMLGGMKRGDVLVLHVPSRTEFETLAKRIGASQSWARKTRHANVQAYRTTENHIYVVRFDGTLDPAGPTDSEEAKVAWQHLFDRLLVEYGIETEWDRKLSRYMRRIKCTRPQCGISQAKNFKHNVPPDQIAKSFTNAGWVVERGKHVCPHCLDADHKGRRAGTTFVGPMPEGRTPIEKIGAVVQSVTTQIAAAAAKPEAVAAPAQRVLPIESAPAKTQQPEEAMEPTINIKLVAAVAAVLEDEFDAEARRYKNGYSDESVAKKTGASPAAVKKVREELHGTMVHPEVAALQARLDTLDSEFEAIEAMMRELRGKRDAVQADIEKMQRDPRFTK